MAGNGYRLIADFFPGGETGKEKYEIIWQGGKQGIGSKSRPKTMPRHNGKNGLKKRASELLGSTSIRNLLIIA
jgi:hypothetical protein